MLKQSVINDIGGQITKHDADYTNDKYTLNQEQIFVDSKFDSFRGDTDILFFHASTMMPQSYYRIATAKLQCLQVMATIIFGAQTAKQLQGNRQKYQHSMKNIPYWRRNPDASKTIKASYMVCIPTQFPSQVKFIQHSDITLSN